MQEVIYAERPRIPLVSFFAFGDTCSQKLQSGLNRRSIYASTGSACSDKKRRLSKTVLSAGLEERFAVNTLRISIDCHQAERKYQAILNGVRGVLQG